MKGVVELLRRRVRSFTMEKKVFQGFGRAGEPAGDLKGDGVRDLYRVNMRRRKIRGEDLSSSMVTGCDLAYSEIDSSRLDNSDIRESDLTSARLHSSSMKGTRVSNTNMEGVRIKDTDLGEASFSVLGMREMVCEGVNFRGARFLLCDLFSSRFKDCTLAGAVFSGCDLSYSVFKDTDLKGVDFRGCDLSCAEFINSPLEGALVKDALLFGIHGVKSGEMALLREGGARTEKGLLRGWMRTLLSSYLSVKEDARIERYAGIGSLAVKLLLLLLICGVVIFVFFKRPPSGTYTTSRPPPPPPKKITGLEREKTKENLKILRKAIRNAYETSGKYGIASYPSMEDIQKNRFDRDGKGPGTERLTLVKGGIPPNLMTDTDGKTIFPYCNDPPTIETVAGDNSDWHYCEETGRVIPCTPDAEINTLEW